MDSFSSLFWAIVFIAVVFVATVGAFVLGVIPITIMVPVVCGLATLQALAIVLAACAAVTPYLRRMVGLPEQDADHDPMLDHYGDVPPADRGGR